MPQMVHLKHFFDPQLELLHFGLLLQSLDPYHTRLDRLHSLLSVIHYARIVLSKQTSPCKLRGRAEA